MLYLALQFPLLPLEALSFPPSPSVLLERGRVLLADGVSQADGIVPGMSLSSALACRPDLKVWERHPELEQQTLEHLAQWAGTFTPRVAMEKKHGLILEIGTCIRLFGGLDSLLERLFEALSHLGHAYTWAAAPTPRGACWLAKAGRNVCIQTSETLDAALSALPVSSADWSPVLTERLNTFGLFTFGELRRLPHAALRERLGTEPLHHLCQAWGEYPEVPVWYVFPENFSQGLELPWKVEQAPTLLFPARRLLAALLGWLESRNGLMQQARLILGQGRQGSCIVTLALAEPGRPLTRLLRLLEEKLRHLSLSAPVQEMTLELDSWCPADQSGNLLATEGSEDLAACLEWLVARMGEDHVYGLALQDDHRPEQAWRRLSVAELLPSFSTISAHDEPSPVVLAKPSRPTWLLPQPVMLEETRSGLLARSGPLKGRCLQLLSAPERIESGWWDTEGAGDLRRDYFVAGCPSGERAWVFRDQKGWFLHGLFA